MTIKHDDALMKFVANEVKRFKGDLTLLDIGSAEEHLKELLPKTVSYKGLDYKGDHDYIRNLDNLPLKIKETFDVVVCLETLEHTKSPHAVMKEILKLGKPGAVFFLSVPNEYNFYCRLNFLLARKTSVQETFNIVDKHLHIHAPRVKDALNFFSEYLDIKDVHYCWYSRTSEHGKGVSKNVFRAIDKGLDKMSRVSPSLFSRSTLVVGTKK